ncbi:MAG: putative toxin-antitoxin system toxin component, PIN family [Neisseriaceae bacterium]|nr:putative toxin-antitoxin system toxin component, PIN family [Neisseriaceae bacterium]
MRILVDTNVLISAIVFGGMPRNLLLNIIKNGHQLFVSSYIDLEFHDKIKKKWINQYQKIYAIYRQIGFIFIESTTQTLGNLRDKKDIPVLSNAIYHQMDIILTGDKDFLLADLEKSLVLSPAMMNEFLQLH